ncbi:MAG: N-6 DNA methylase [Candidatus Nanoarchaeia archaeon]|nr:N-6 DNA methylase [Candidatus Nanoarchaeia archaeon]
MKINELFKDETERGLTLFDKKLIDYIDIFIKNGKPYIKCLATDIDRPAKPEEIVRQLFILKLMREYGYPKERITAEKEVWFGSGVSEKRADIVVFHKGSQEPYIIVEVKKPKRKDGVKQLKSYCNAEGSPVAVWSNGKDIEIMHRENSNNFIHISDIPEVDQTVNDVLTEPWTFQKLTKENRLAKGLSLREVIQNLENLVLANAGVDAFEEVFKLIYAKLYDEFSANTKSERKGRIMFRIYGESNEELYDKIQMLFEGAKEQWKGIFSERDRINLTASHLATCVSFFQDIKLFNSNLFVIDEAFEYLVTQVSKGEKGQYFTPRHVIDMCVKIINPTKKEYVIDTACGSCGFTIHTLFHAFNSDGIFSAMEPSREQIEYASNMIYGIDFDERAVKIAKALNLIAGDGKTNVYKANSLDSSQWNSIIKVGIKDMLKKLKSYEESRDNEKNFKYFNFDVLMTNPPFAGEISEKQILKNYILARKKNKVTPKMHRHILFIERNLNFLKDGGRMAIVLPQGIFNNSTEGYIRDFISDKARILGIVSLHDNTFKPHTGTKTSVLFLQKWDDKLCPKKEDYPIFFAVSEKSGKNNSGNYVFQKDKENKVIIDKHGHPVIEHDLDEIADEFITFLKRERLSFW